MIRTRSGPHSYIAWDYLQCLNGAKTWYGSSKIITLIASLEGIGCAPILVSASAEEILGWMEGGVALGTLRFPEVNAPIHWPNKPLAEVLGPIEDETVAENATEAA